MGSNYNTGPYINFPHFGNSNLGKLPYSDYYRDPFPHSLLSAKELRAHGLGFGAWDLGLVWV